jgi:hypothetical protein
VQREEVVALRKRGKAFEIMAFERLMARNIVGGHFKSQTFE